MSLFEAISVMRDSQALALPLYDEIERSTLLRILTPDEIFNFFTENYIGDDDIIYRQMHDLPIGMFEFTTGDTSQSLFEALRFIVERKVSHLPICSETGDLVGCVFGSDITKILTKTLHTSMGMLVL
jgi:CBS domain-containing protein